MSPLPTGGASGRRAPPESLRPTITAADVWRTIVALEQRRAICEPFVTNVSKRNDT